MSNFWQLANKENVVNLDNLLQVTDLYLDDTNIFLRNNIEYYYYSDQKLLNLNLIDSEVSYSKEGNALKGIFLSQDQDTIEITVSIDEKKINIKIVVIESQKEYFDFFVYIPPDFGSNSSRDCGYFDPEINAIVFYENEFFLTCKSSSHEIESYTIQSPKDNNGNGSRPLLNKRLINNPITAGSVDGCMHYKIKNKDKFQFIMTIDDTPDRSNQKKSSTILNFKKFERSIKQLEETSRIIIKNSFRNVGGNFAGLDTTYFKNGNGVEDYTYFWPRDGAYTIETAVREKIIHEEQQVNFWEFVHKAFNDKPYLEHRYRLNNHASLGSSWLPKVNSKGESQLGIQLDETTSTIWAYENYKRLTGDKNKPLEEHIVNNVSQFLQEQLTETYVHKPTYDLWENEWGQHLSTQISLIAAFMSINKLKKNTIGEDIIEKSIEAISKIFFENDNFIRTIKTDSGLYDYQIDSAAMLIAKYFDLEFLNKYNLKEKFDNYAELVESKLRVSDGIARFENDFYLKNTELDNNTSYPGNPWFITTSLLGQYYAITGKTKKAENHLNFFINHMDNTGLLAEMTDPVHGIGMSIKPLVWSHVEALNLLSKINVAKIK